MRVCGHLVLALFIVSVSSAETYETVCANRTDECTGLFGGKAVKLNRAGGDLSSHFRKNNKKRDDKVEIPHRSEDIVLDFNGEQLTWGQLDRHIDLRMKISPLKIPPVATEDEVRQIITMTRNKYATNFVRAYVKNAVLAQAARKRGIALAAGELDQAMTNALRKLQPKFREQAWAVVSSSNSYFRLDQENYLLTRAYRTEVLAKCIVISNEEVEAEIRSRQEEIAAAKAANARMRPTLEKWMTEIRSGKRSFAKTASDFSDCDSRIDDGAMGVFSQECLLRPELKAFAFAPSTNELSEIIETPYAYHVLKVDQRFYDDEAAEQAENPEMGLSDAETDDESTNVVAMASHDGLKAPTAVRLSQIMLEKKEIPEELDATAAREEIFRRKLGRLTVDEQLKLFDQGQVKSVFTVNLRKKKGKRK